MSIRRPATFAGHRPDDEPATRPLAPDCFDALPPLGCGAPATQHFSMQTLLGRLRRNRFAVIGRAGLDLYPQPDGTRIEDAHAFRADVGGSAGNIAVALARLGASAAVVSPLADDPVGRFTRKTLQAYGVDCSMCRAVGGDARNTLALAETRPEDCEVVIYRNGAADLELEAGDVRSIDFRATGAVIVTGTALVCEPSRGAVLEALALARDAGTVTVLDLDYRAYSWPSQQVAGAVYREAAALGDVVIGNDAEFAVLSDGADALTCARSLGATGAHLVIYKMGAEGSWAFADEAVLRTGIYPVETAKPFGAGDAFMGALMAALAAGDDLAEALALGSAAAALVVSRAGCASAMPTRQELDIFIAGRSPSLPAAGSTHAHSAF